MMIAIGLTLALLIGIMIVLWGDNSSLFHVLWIGAVFFAIPMFVIPGIIALAAGEEYEKFRGDLVAIAPDTETPGAYFFLGSGVSEEKPIFQYIQRSPEGFSEIKTIPVSDAKIYEDSSVDPYISIMSVKMEAWWLAPWPVDTLARDIYFHIPEGSITSNYTVLE